MNTKKYLLGMTAAAILFPAAAFAQTSNIQTNLQSLLDELAALRRQFTTITASSGSATGTAFSTILGGSAQCSIVITRNLRLGVRGDDVRSLQQMLNANPEFGFNTSPTGYFGPLTAKAVANFQIRMGIASSTDGSVGPLTRTFLQRSCTGIGSAKTTPIPSPIASVVTGNAPFIGRITVSTPQSITIKNNNGKSVVVYFTSSTTIMKGNWSATRPATGTISDLIVGEDAAAQGQVSTDESIRATLIDVGTLPSAPPATPLSLPKDGAPGGPASLSTLPPATSGSTAPPGGHCGGLTANASTCQSGYQCQLSPVADAGGICVPK